MLSGTPAGSDAVVTGFPSLDAVLGGGIRRGDLLVLGGDAGSGKSSLALSIAANAAQGQDPALFFSTEMQPSRLRERLATMTMAPPGTNPIFSEPLLRLVPPGTALETVVADVKAAGDAALVVVDHLESLATGARPQDEDLAAAVRGLKALALASNAAVLLVAHCSVDRVASPVPRPTLADFGANGAIQQHADAVVALYREEMYETARGIDGATELHVLKNRHGSRGYIDLFFHKQWLRFEDMVDEGADG